jgi:hypothetical protein
MRKQALLEGIRTGAASNILFPKDIISNASEIFDSYRQIFPPDQGSFLVGPFLKLAWPTPPLISLSLGIVLELPGDMVILGVLAATIPEKVPVLVLQVAFVGVIEFSRKRLFFFAALFDSRIVSIPLGGEIGVLAAFGDDPTLLVTAGGFHPRFAPPPLPFPRPERLSLEILNRSDAHIRGEVYLAITSNTVQFGARAELFFGFDDLTVEGDIRFDCLFRFSPFHFEVEFCASLAVKVFGVGCFGISVNAKVEGPTPWRVHGKARISLFLIDITVTLDKTWGDEGATTLPPIAVFPLLITEYDRPETWSAVLPRDNKLLVTLRPPTEPEKAILIHPTGTLRVSQRSVPLDLTLDLVGQQKPNDVRKLSLAVSGGVLVKVDDAFEQFAVAQFQQMNDGEKLSRPSYESMNGGIELGSPGEQLACGRAVKRNVRYDEIVIDTNQKRSERRVASFPRGLFEHFLKNGSVGRSPLSKLYQQRLRAAEQRITVDAERFAVVLRDSNKPLASNSIAFNSEVSAREYLRSRVAAEPHLAGHIQVIVTQERSL